MLLTDITPDAIVYVMITRTLEKRLRQQAKKYPVVAVTGPRQSGKTTLVTMTFPGRPYVSLDDPDSPQRS
jgi:predicted AAA+ superfamily ATPase